MNKLLTAVVLSCSLSAAPVMADTQIEDASLVFDTISKNTQALAVLSADEMEATEGEFVPLAFLAGTLIAAAGSAWTNHAVSYYNTGQPASLNSTLWSLGSGALGGAHGGGLALGAGLNGFSKAYTGLRGVGVGASWNTANPF